MKGPIHYYRLKKYFNHSDFRTTGGKTFVGDLEYIPPLMEVLGLAEVEHNPKNNRMRAL
jgi:hypothetical protein